MDEQQPQADTTTPSVNPHTETNHRQDDDTVILPDGGERHGKPAPPEDILAAPSNHLGTEPHPQSVTKAIVELLDATEAIVGMIDSPSSHGIDTDDGEVTQLVAFADALQEGELQISADKSEQKETQQTQRLQAQARDIREQQSLQSPVARQLIDHLGSIETGSSEHTTVLQETIDELESYKQLQAALNSASRQQEPLDVGRELGEQLEGLNTSSSERLTEIGEQLVELSEQRDKFQAEYNQLTDNIDSICNAATEQTQWSSTTTNESEQIDELLTALNENALWFADHSSSVSGIAEAVDADEIAQSKPAKEFLRTLRNSTAADHQRVTEQLHTAVQAIDRTETIQTRLQGVDGDALVRTADRLLSELETRHEPVASLLADRITTIKETAQQANEADLVLLYAARRELQYYDRTLLPELGKSPEEETDTGITARINSLDERRSEMRQSYPTEYPDCDHTIPIYFLDLTAELVEEAQKLDSRNDQARAAGVATAAEKLLDWIAGLYETHSYFVLLKDLRG